MGTIEQEVEKIKEKLKQESKIEVNIAVFGQPGAGKSSLINAIIGEKKAEVGVETDKTVEAGYYQYNGLNFIDLPGYGTKQFPKETYFEKFDILNKDLFLCVTDGKLHQSDVELFEKLHDNNKTCIFVINKLDQLWEDGVSLEELKTRKILDLKKHTNENIITVFTSCKTKEGLDELNTSIQNNLDKAKKERYTKNAKAYSEKFLKDKKSILESTVTKYAGISAANALNPIPGADVAVDVGILLKLFDEIKSSYGITDDKLKQLEKLAPMATSAANQAVNHLVKKILEMSTKQGLIKLMAKYATRKLTQSVTKYIPFVGQAIAATIGFTLTKIVGSEYLDYCHDLAEKIMKKELEA